MGELGNFDRRRSGESESIDRNGRRYSMRVRPYKTTDNRIEGAVIVLIDKRG
ncbi:MAG: PAS domain-containing protein [Thermoanaerobaculia bacterium]